MRCNTDTCYSESSPSVLNNISLTIKPGEKIGICGRSGSGKSSLILAIFRMIELNEGTITIDGIDISTLNRGALRERLNAIPQDPFFLSGTVRENCDPRGTSTDEAIEDALRKVHLWDVIEDKGGLDAELTQDFFSHGQRQLFCLARAILHPSKIVIMDEATSKYVFQPPCGNERRLY
jgi:ATP-binding cassette, subfamily C (CFTR/MRP), member 1